MEIPRASFALQQMADTLKLTVTPRRSIDVQNPLPLAGEGRVRVISALQRIGPASNWSSYTTARMSGMEMRRMLVIEVASESASLRSITPEMALRLERVTGVRASHWLTLQLPPASMVAVKYRCCIA